MKQSLGQFISTLRKAQSYTQADVAEKLNISNRTLSSWETDRTAPDIGILPALADLYGVSVDEILRCERQPKNAETSELSDEAKRSMRKNRFAKFCGKRILLTGLSLLGAAVFIAAGAILLYSSAPLWLTVLLTVLGAGGNAACVVLIAYFQYSALRCEGIIFKEDYTENNRAYALTLRRKTANAFLLNSLPYILGAIVYLIVFFAAELYDYSISVGGVNVQIDYTTPTAVLTSLCCLFGLSLAIFGLVYRNISVKNLGDEKQTAVRNHNKKLLLKLLGFGSIPIVLIAITFIIFVTTDIESVYDVYFTARSVEEVRQNFQTLTISESYTESIFCERDENGEPVYKEATYPAGEYFLNFQSESYVELLDYSYAHGVTKLYDLGNGFYGKIDSYSEEEGFYQPFWNVYRVWDGVSLESATAENTIGDFFDYYTYYNSIRFEFAGERHYAVNVAYKHNQYDENYDYGNGYFGYKFQALGRYYEEENEYRYEYVCYDDYSPIAGWMFFAVIDVTVITCTVIWLVKRKKSEFAF